VRSIAIVPEFKIV